MAKDKKKDDKKPESVQDFHKSDKSLTRASDKNQKPKGKTEKALRKWVEDVDNG